MSDTADRLFNLKLSDSDDDLRVARFSGTEGMSQLFRFDVTVGTQSADITLEDVVSKTATLEVFAGKEARLFNGLVSDFELLDSQPNAPTAYRITLVPKVWLLANGQAFRIFQEQTAPEIIETVLSDAGLSVDEDFRFSLTGQGSSSSYRTREYCVQYRESDWAFVSRLMEEAGMFYYFEHSADGHMLVIGDNPSACGSLDEPVVYRTKSGAVVASEYIDRFRLRERVRPSKVVLRDFNFKKPDLDLEKAAEAGDGLEVMDYPGEYDTPDDGKNLAQVRLERYQAERRTGAGSGSCALLTAGHSFELCDHPRADVNRSYLVTTVEHRGAAPFVAQDGAATYSNTFRCMPDDVVFRAPLSTPKPVIRGVQTALVVGPSEEEIHTDEHGRVKVQFHWDRHGESNESSSCWIRVSQMWAGKSWGTLFLPRIGHEVVVDFIEGDPDRPMVVGSVYHGTNVPPYTLPDDMTKSTLKSNSSTGGEGLQRDSVRGQEGQRRALPPCAERHARGSASTPRRRRLARTKPSRWGETASAR